MPAGADIVYTYIYTYTYYTSFRPRRCVNYALKTRETIWGIISAAINFR